MPATGLDIGTASIKVVQLEKSGDKFKLLAAGIASTPKGGIESDGEQDLVNLASAIKRLMTDTKIATKAVNIALPEDKVFTRVIKLPYLTDQEVDSAISWQAEPYIPIPVSEANLDYQVIHRESPAGGKPGGVDVLLVAAPKALVSKYIKVCEMAGLSISILETELMALSRSVVGGSQVSVVVDSGESSTGIGIVQGGHVLVSHSVSSGGAVLTRAVAASLAVSPEQAEEYKKTYGMGKALEGKVRAALEPVIRVIVDEIRKAIQYYKTEAGEVAPSSIIISGGLAGMPEVISFFSNSLNMETVVGDPFVKIVKDARISGAFAAYSPLYGIAIGLAMQ